MSNKHKRFCTTLHYIEHFLILASAVTGCISVSVFASLLCIPSSKVGLKLYAMTEGIKNYDSIIKKKKKHQEIVLLAKSKLHSIEVLIYKALISSSISHDEFVLINNDLKEYNDMKQEIKNIKT